MIAGTSFNLCDVSQHWSALAGRIARTNTPVKTLDLAYKAAHKEEAVSLLCDDGLVIITLEAHADGTITAMVLLAASFGDAGAFKRQEEPMMQVARDMGAQRLAFRTDRRGWARLLGPEWRLDGEVFSRSL